MPSSVVPSFRPLSLTALLAALLAALLVAPPVLAQEAPTEAGAQAAPVNETAPRGEAAAPSGYAFSDPNGSRYLLGASAVPLRRGEVVLSQKELLFTSVALGATEHLTLLAGSAVPLWFLPDNAGLNFTLGGRYGGEVLPGLHVAGALEAFFLPGGPGSGTQNVLAVGSGTLTYGGPDAHLTLNLARPVAFTGPLATDPPFGTLPFITTLSGSLRVGPHVALLTEHWALPYVGSEPFATTTFHGAGVRLMNERLSVDLGLFGGGTWQQGTFRSLLPFPVLPWLDLSYRFG